MSNLDDANALLTAINFDRFAEIEARHAPDVRFHSFRGPDLNSSVAVHDWHRTFLRDYADCSYGETEAVQDGDTVAIRATIEAKGYDYRPFSQRVVEVMTFADGLVQERRLYGMLSDLELDKPTNAAMTAALEFPGGNVNDTRKAATGFFDAILAGDAEAAGAFLAEKAVVIDTVYGTAQGPEKIAALFAGIPRPAFGTNRVTHVFAGPKDACVETSYDPARPRAASWVRMLEGKIQVIETYWMLREIGVSPRVDQARARALRQVILPI
ncbi:MAG: nuclear transport factor 2 family protein [Dehalococcoidia bacterium]|nr:nuclear transport factor 2 family protein [Dehalococcoidia bacterium]